MDVACQRRPLTLTLSPNSLRLLIFAILPGRGKRPTPRALGAHDNRRAIEIEHISAAPRDVALQHRLELPDLPRIDVLAGHLADRHLDAGAIAMREKCQERRTDEASRCEHRRQFHLR